VLVLHIGVDIGVIPQGTDLIPLLPPVLSSIGSTVGTAAMNQNRLHMYILSLSPVIYQG